MKALPNDFYRFFAEKSDRMVLELLLGDPTMVELDFAAFVGIDWSDKKHDICLREAGSKRNEVCVVAQKPEALEQWAATLRKRFCGQKVAVCLEQSRGALISALLKYEFLVLYPVNPSTLAKYREAFSPSRVKDDPTDAEYLVELLQSHRDRLRPWQPADPQTRKLQYLVEHRRTLVDERTRLSNRLTAHLKGYFPQVLEWFSDIRTQLAVDFLLAWPNPEALKGVHSTTLSKFFCKYGSRRAEKNEERIAAMRALVPLTTDAAIVDSSSLMVQALCRQLKELFSSVKLLDAEIEKLTKEHEDFPVFNSLPGAGEAFVPRLIAAFGSQRSRFTSADEAATYFGIAPAMERSGNSTHIRWRYFCPKFLRQTFHEFAGASIQFSFWAEQHYRGQRMKGKSHHVAVRSLAFKWLRIIFRCWQNRTPYNEATYLKALSRKDSQLLELAAKKAA